MCRAGARWEISTSTTHFFYEPKTTLKIKFIYKKKKIILILCWVVQDRYLGVGWWVYNICERKKRNRGDSSHDDELINNLCMEQVEGEGISNYDVDLTNSLSTHCIWTKFYFLREHLYNVSCIPHIYVLSCTLYYSP